MSFGSGGGFDLGTAYGRVIIDGSGATASIDEVRQSFISMMGDVGQNMVNVGANLTALTAPLTAFGVTGVGAVADFDGILREIEARTGATSVEMEGLRQVAIQMGADTAFSASSSAQAMLELMSSGASAEEAVSLLPTVLDAAAASGADLGEAADSVTDILAAFQLDVSEGARVTNALSQAAASGSATMTDLAAGFGNVGPVAAMYGLSIEDTAAALQVFSENGIKGAEAGTQLRSMLMNMTRSTNEVDGAWDQLGVRLYDNQGNMRDITAIIQDMNDSMEEQNLNDLQRNSILTTLGGSYGVMGLNALLAADGLDTMQGSMEGAATASDVAAARMGGWNGAIEALGGSMETLQITVLTPLINDVLIPMVDWTTELLNKFNAWAINNPELARVITLVGAALAALGPVMIVIGQALSSASVVVEALGTAFTVLTGPIGLAIVAGAALVAAYMTNFGGLKDWVDGTLLPVFQNFFNYIRDVWEAEVKPKLEALVMWFTTDGMALLVAFVKDTIIPTVRQLAGTLVSLWTRVSPHLQSLLDWFVSIGFPVILEFILGSVLPGIESLVTLLVDIWERVQPGLLALAEWFLTSGLPGVVAFLNEIVIPAFNAYIDLLSLIWITVSPHLARLKAWFTNTGLPQIVQKILDVIAKVLEFKQSLITFWENVQGPLQTFKDGFMLLLQPVLDFVNTIKDAWNSLTSGISNFEFPEIRLPQINVPWGGHDGGMVPGFAGGGYTGNISTMGVAGVVHGGEYVVPHQGALVLRDKDPEQGDQGPSMAFYGDIVLPESFFTPGQDPTTQAVNFFEALQEEVRIRG